MMEPAHLVPEDPAASPAPATLGELARCLVRSRWMLARWMLVGLLVAGLGAATRKPVFRAQATILIEQQGTPGLLGDLAVLASVATAPATASELSVLESRTLAAEVAEEGSDDAGAWDPRDERSVGLATLVEDPALRPVSLARRALFESGPPEVPLVLPERGLFARVTSAAAEAPEKIAVEFLGPARVRLATVGLRQTLRLESPHAEEHAFVPRAPLAYRGLVLELEPWGAYEGARFVVQHLPRHEALRRLRDRLSVRETALNSGVIEVTLEDTEPRRGARTVNALCRRYLDALVLRGQRRASQTVEYVQGLLDEELVRFEEAHGEIERLQRENPELIAPEGAATSLIEQMATLEVERVQVELARRAFEEIVAALESGDRRALARIDGTLTVGVLVDPVTTGLLAELARLEAQASMLGTDLLDGHPLLARNSAATGALVERTREQLASRMDGLRARGAELESIQGELRARLSEMPAGMRELAETRVQFGIHRELVPYLIKSLQSAEITRSSAETFAELVDPAVPPDELAAPDLVTWAVLGLLAGLGIGMVLVFAREPARGRVHTLAELADALGTGPVVGLPRLPGRELVFRSARTSPAAESLRKLRGALRFGADGTVRRSVGVTTLGDADLGAAIAAELAQAFASEGRRTLLVEADQARRGPSVRFALEEAPGLGEHLEDGRPWQDLVRATAGGPDVLTSGKTSAPPGDLLTRPAAERFLFEAAAQYDAVVLALPEASALSAVPGFARALDVLCLVHRARSLARLRVMEAVRALRGAGARAIAGVLIDKRAVERREARKRA